MRRIAAAALLMALALPAGARAAESPATPVDVPAGTVSVGGGELHAGGVGTQIRMDVDLSKDPGNATLQVTLPSLVDRVTGSPRLTDSAGGRVDLSQQGHTVALDLNRARAGDFAQVSLTDLGLPAGTYDLPVRWVKSDGSTVDAGDLHVVLHAGVREGDAPDWNRVGAVRLDENASSDSAEESETFDTTSPWDSDRILVAANKSGDLTGGFFLSNDRGHTFGEVHLSSALAVPGGGVQGALLSGDPILASDDLGNMWAGGLTVCADAAHYSRIFVERIPAGGSSFVSPGVGLPVLHGAGECDSNQEPIQDKPMMSIDDYPSSPTYGRLYVTWDDPDPSGGVNVVVSACDTRPGGYPNAANCDNPDNWSTPLPISGSPGSYVSSDSAVGPDGRVYVAWWNYAGAASGGNNIQIVSCAAGATDCRTGGWSSPAALAQLTTPRIPFSCPTPAQPGGRVGEVPSLAVGPDGRIYASWSDLRTDSGTTRCTQNFVDSTEQSWDSFVASAASLSDLLASGTRTSTSVGTRVVSDTVQPGSDEWFPWVAVDRTTGQAYVDYYSTTNDSSRQKADFFLRTVAAGSGTQASLGSPQQVDSSPSDYSGNPCCNFGNDYGDYTGLTAAEGFAFPIWTSRPSSVGNGDEHVFVPDATSPQLVFDSGVLSDAPGDGDGTVEPGEPFTVTVRLRNTGPAGASNLRGTLLAPAGGATFDTATASFADVGSGGTTDGSNAFSGRIASGVPCNVSVSLRLDVSTDQGPESVPVLIPVGCNGGYSPPSPPAPPTTTTPGPVKAPTTTAPNVTVAVSPGGKVSVSRQSLSTVLKKGLLARVSCTRTCTVTLTLLLPPPKGKRVTTITLARLTVRNVQKTKTVRLKLGKTSRKRLRASHRKTLTLQLVATTSAGGRQSQAMTVKLR